MKNILNYKLFEYKNLVKIKTRWTADDAIMTLYYEKFGLRKLGYTEDQIEEFVNYNIGSTETSLKMQAQNIRYILSLERGEIPEGLSHFSKAQIETIKKYNKLTEPELRKMVEEIIDKISDDEKLNNAIKSEKEKEEQKIQSIISMPLDKYGNPMRTLKDIEKDIDIPLQVGDIVDHKKFGKGEVLSIDGNLIEIKFITKTEMIIYYYNAFNWNDENKTKIEKPKLRQIPTKTPKMLIDTILPKPTKKLNNFKNFSVKPELEDPKNIYGKSMSKIGKIEVSPFKIGDTVNHKKFGIGKVITINNNNTLSIEFITGLKTVSYKPELFN